MARNRSPLPALLALVAGLWFMLSWASPMMFAQPPPAFSGDKASHEILKEGATDLMKASYEGDVAKVRELVESGSDVNAQDAYGWTPVRYAVRMRHAKVVETLLELGADVNIASNTLRTPLMSAATNGLEEITALLVEQGDADIMAQDENGETAFVMAKKAGHVPQSIEDLVAGGQTVGAGEGGWNRNTDKR
eukprot:TRINITY_DN82898_c0_g1_i1.p1 TRINITY_DN82898_c0_g1~~TRINITY_DN82898_c0_g1_i1.p1  ORF type:complete len:192 (-),score=45.04 TRINITY_DN82898_c0_g1_i1:139-714(-)